MEVMFTGEAEKRRVENASETRKSQWEYLVTSSMAEAVRYAKNHGWKKKKVQVRVSHTGMGEMEYSVEPFEKDCKCPNILRYKDFYD
jgi:hypothetical protein